MKSISRLMTAVALVLTLPLAASADEAVKMTFGADARNKLETPALLKKRAAFMPDRRRNAVSRADGFIRMPSFGKAQPMRKSAYAPSREVAMASAPLYGMLAFSEITEATRGLYEIGTTPTANDPQLVTGALPYAEYLAGGALHDGKYYFNYLVYDYFEQSGYHGIADATTWEVLETVPGSLEVFDTYGFDIAYCEADNLLYGCYYNASATGYIFASQNPSTFETKKICSMPVRWDACDFDRDGNLYAITAEGDLVLVDKMTGTTKLIASTGIEAAFIGSGAIDRNTGIFYWAVNPDDGNSYLVALDTRDGTSTLIYNFAHNEEFFGMYMDAVLVDKKAPAAVGSLTAAFPGAGLSGQVSFTMPLTLYDGTVVNSGDTLGYTVTLDGEVIAFSTARPGEKVTVDVTVPAEGYHTFVAYASNALGDGMKSSASLYVGNDRPKAAEDVVLTYADGTFRLTWSPVTEGALNGYIGDVVYDVVRLAGTESVTVARDLTICAFSEVYPEPAEGFLPVSYEVVARTATAQGQPAVSNSVLIGKMLPPCGETFTEDELYKYTIIDANSDHTSWTIVGEAVQVLWNPNEASDDWIITPAIELEGGMIYQYSVVCRAMSSQFAERIEVCMGDSPTVDGMTTRVIAPTVLTSEERTTLTGSIPVDKTGKYFIGIHGISDAGRYSLVVFSWEVTAPMLGASPAAVGDLDVTSPAGQTGKAVVTFTTPATNLMGNAITSLSKVEVYCDDSLASTLRNPAVNTAQTLTIDGLTEGYHTFKVVAYNETGAGEAAEVRAYVGINTPGPVEGAKVVETSTPGQVTISWKAPSVDVDGKPIDPALITYNICDMDFEPIAEGLSATEFTCRAVDPDAQTFVSYMIFAQTVGGESKGARTNMLAVGKPYALPFIEGFDNGTLTHPMAVTNDTDYTLWNIGTPEEFGIDDVDGNAGFVYLTGDYVDEMSTLCTGKIAVQGKSPVLSFYWYGLGEADENVVTVYVECEGVTYDLNTIQQSEYGWTREIIPLDEFVGKNVQIEFEGIILTHKYILLDNITVSELSEYDLAAVSIEAPAKVAPGEEFAISAVVRNVGMEVFTAPYTVELVRNGEVAATLAGHEIDVEESIGYTFLQTLSVVDEEETVYSVRVVSDTDGFDANNSTMDYPVILALPDYPVVRDIRFTATTETSGVLAWEAPDTSDSPKLAVTDDFESYEAWSYANVGDWTIVDGDGAPMGGIQNVELPGLTSGSSPVAYFVMNSDDLGGYSHYAAHSGVQYMATMFNSDGAPNDDWLISPELCGDAQTITFWTRAYTTNYGYESFEVLYSMTDRQISSFVSVGYDDQVGSAWMRYSVDLPAGAKYFAIRYISQDKFMFFVDDVTYIPANAETLDLTVLGYNIYDSTGRKLNDKPVDTTSYLLEGIKRGDVFRVCVVYGVGESAPVSCIADGLTGLADVAGLDIRVNGRAIVVTGAAGGVSVLTADGKTVHSSQAGIATVAVAPGVYVVKAGRTVRKVVVK